MKFMEEEGGRRIPQLTCFHKISFSRVSTTVGMYPERSLLFSFFTGKHTHSMSSVPVHLCSNLTTPGSVKEKGLPIRLLLNHFVLRDIGKQTFGCTVYDRDVCGGNREY